MPGANHYVHFYDPQGFWDAINPGFKLRGKYFTVFLELIEFSIQFINGPNLFVEDVATKGMDAQDMKGTLAEWAHARKMAIAAGLTVLRSTLQRDIT